MIYLFDLAWPLIVFLVVAMMFSGLVHGALGLGFSMVTTPIIAIVLDVRSAILISLLPTVIVNLATIASGSDLFATIRRFLPLVICSLLGSLAGTFLLASVDPNPFRLVLAALTLMYLFSSYLGTLPRQMLEQHRWAAMIVFGMLAGLSGGTTNVMVAVLLVYFLSIKLPRASMLPVLNSCFLVGKVGQIIIFAQADMIGVGSILQALPLAGAALAALLVGQRIQRRIEADSYRRMLEMLLIVLSVILIVQFFIALG